MIPENTPYQIIDDEVCRQAGVQLIIKREDLNHPYAQGNKWWKLKYNIEKAKQEDHHTLLTFGGAYSNHIYATAALAKENGLYSIGIIRGEEILPLNKTLAFAKTQGMQLRFISRSAYREKTDTAFQEELKNDLGEFYLIPEGGTNQEAIRGCEEFGFKLLKEIPFDEVFLAVGTGGTIAGLICAFQGQKKVTGVSVLKDGGFLEEEISSLVRSHSGNKFDNWKLLITYHHGGYAKITKELLCFIEVMRSKHNLPLDHVYTGKMMYALFSEIKKGNFKRGSTILAIHTGGLQGALSSNT